MAFWQKTRVMPRVIVLFSDPTKYISQYILIFGLIALSLGMLSLQYIRADWREQVSFIVLDYMIIPVVSTVGTITHTIEDTFDNISAFIVMKEHIQDLESENERLKYLQNLALQLEEENRALRELMNFPRAYARDYVSARVFADGGGTYGYSLLIDVGADQGIEKGQAVLSGQALVGRIITVAENWSRVLLIQDVNSMIPVISRWQREPSLLVGGSTDLLKLDMVPTHHSFAVGEQLLTSGEGGAIPADIPVAVIEKVEGNEISAKPLAHPERVGMVVVVDYLVKDNPVPKQFTK